jgi:hypothetical protein
VLDVRFDAQRRGRASALEAHTITNKATIRIRIINLCSFQKTLALQPGVEQQTPFFSVTVDFSTVGFDEPLRFPGTLA